MYIQGCQDDEQYMLWRNGLKYLCSKQHFFLRNKIRHAINSGNLVLSPSKKIIHSRSPSQNNEAPQNHYRHQPKTTFVHQKEDSHSKSSSFWNSLFG